MQQQRKYSQTISSSSLPLYSHHQQQSAPIAIPLPLPNPKILHSVQPQQSQLNLKNISLPSSSFQYQQQQQQQKQQQINININPPSTSITTTTTTSKIIQSYQLLLQQLNKKLKQNILDLQLTKQKLQKTQLSYGIILGYLDQKQKINVNRLIQDVDLLEKKVINQNAQILRLKAKLLIKNGNKNNNNISDNDDDNRSQIQKRDISKFFNFEQMRENDQITKRLRKNSAQQQQASFTWQKALQQHSQFNKHQSSPTKFKRKTVTILKKFIPHEQRCKVWPVIFQNTLGLSQTLYIQLSQKRNTIQQHVRSQIQRDILRSFNNKMDFSNKQVLGIEVQQILEIFHLLRPDISYVQGMTYPVIILTIVVGKMMAWRIWGNLIVSNKFFRNMYSFQQKSIDIYCKTFELLLKQTHPQIHTHLQNLTIKPQLFLIQWFFTIFSRGLSLQSTLKLWDLIGYQRQLILYRMCQAIFQLIGKRLLNQKKYQETVGLIQSYWASIDQGKLLEIVGNSKVSSQKLGRLFMKATKEIYGRDKGKQGKDGGQWYKFI